jgi:hypothetical protein
MMVIVEHGFAIALVFVELGAGFEFGRGERGGIRVQARQRMMMS